TNSSAPKASDSSSITRVAPNALLTLRKTMPPRVCSECFMSSKRRSGPTVFRPDERRDAQHRLPGVLRIVSVIDEVVIARVPQHGRAGWAVNPPICVHQEHPVAVGHRPALAIAKRTANVLGPPDDLVVRARRLATAIVERHEEVVVAAALDHEG